MARKTSDVSGCGSTRPAARSAADGSVRQRQPDVAIGAPAWPELPGEAQAALISLMTQLILEHARQTLGAGDRGGRP